MLFDLLTSCQGRHSTIRRPEVLRLRPSVLSMGATAAGQTQEHLLAAASLDMHGCRAGALATVLGGSCPASPYEAMATPRLTTSMLPNTLVLNFSVLKAQPTMKTATGIRACSTSAQACLTHSGSPLRDNARRGAHTGAL